MDRKSDGCANVIAGRFMERQATRYRTNIAEPVGRAAFYKTHGCASATFTVDPDLPSDLRVGVFAGSSYDALVRFASDPSKDTSDLAGNTVGMAIKLFGIAGTKLLDGVTDADTHDFLLQNSDVFPVGTAKAFMELEEIALSGDAAAYMGLHPEVARILAGMKKQEDSVLWASYNSTTPYRFGTSEGGRFVKYLASVRRKTGGPAIPKGRRDENYLGTDLARRLGKAGCTLDFFVQFHVDDASTPLDDISTPWDPRHSAPVRVASLRIPKQTIDDPTACDHLSFNPWHALPEHEPVGSINEARRVAYVLSADARRRMNGEPIAEPSTRP